MRKNGNGKNHEPAFEQKSPLELAAQEGLQQPVASVVPLPVSFATQEEAIKAANFRKGKVFRATLNGETKFVLANTPKAAGMVALQEFGGKVEPIGKKGKQNGLLKKLMNLPAEDRAALLKDVQAMESK